MHRFPVNILPVVSFALIYGCGGNDGGRTASGPVSRPSDEITTQTGITMIKIPAGEFVMGSANGEDDEKPAHTVQISAFSMDKYEVTQRAYEALMGTNPSKFKGPDRPVERASWLSAIRYCNARSLMEGLTPCYDATTLALDPTADGYRLPTETEWEYACRASTTTPYSFGADPADLRRDGWYKENADDTTHPVGRRNPNPWGLHDMHGNVAEWCQDYYAADHYSKSESADPGGPASGDERVLRGGSWRSTADACRSSARYSEAPGFADVCFGYEAYGFRCVRRAP